MFKKKPNILFAHCKLNTSNQNPGETIEAYVLRLSVMAKSCVFKDVIAQQYEDEVVLGSFIKWIEDIFIRQKLLESKELKLEEAISNATILKRAHENAREFESSQEAHKSITVTEVESDKQEHEFTERCALTAKESKTTNGSIIKECRNCGYIYEYGKCAAYNQECYNCGKLGH